MTNKIQKSLFPTINIVCKVCGHQHGRRTGEPVRDDFDRTVCEFECSRCLARWTRKYGKRKEAV